MIPHELVVALQAIVPQVPEPDWTKYKFFCAQDDSEDFNIDGRTGRVEVESVWSNDETNITGYQIVLGDWDDSEWYPPELNGRRGPDELDVKLFLQDFSDYELTVQERIDWYERELWRNAKELAEAVGQVKDHGFQVGYWQEELAKLKGAEHTSLLKQALGL